MPAALWILSCTAGCWAPVGPGVSGLVERGPTDGASLELTYLGTGGWVIRYGADVVLGAPFFSNPSLVRTGLGVIEPDTLEIDRQMERLDVADARVILVGHGHYDHLMDVPHVARRHAPRARILASHSTRNLLGLWSGLQGRVDVVESFAADVESTGTWIPHGPSLRVLALRSEHAPHFDGLELYDGSARRPRDRSPRTAAEWLGGKTFAFLVDFLEPSGAIAWRVYLQDAVSEPPHGLAPGAVIDERPVDVAILVPATFDQVEWSPEAFVENLRPAWILLGHWENFFVPLDAETRSLTLTDQGHYERRLEKVFDGEYWRPEIGTRFRFRR